MKSNGSSPAASNNTVEKFRQRRKRQVFTKDLQAWTLSKEIGIIPHSMEVPFPCATKGELFNAYANATRRYANAVGKMMQKIGILPRDQYESLTIATGLANRLSLEALETLDAHTR